jgi:hypothetical protein
MYNWMMVYLGCDIHYCYHNQIGVAFSKHIEGPYVKYDLNPIVEYSELFHWGAGQPCVISLDSKGSFRLLYTRTVHEYARRHLKSRTFWRDIDLSDANQPVIGEEVALHEGGITNRGLEGECAVFNPSIVWDRKRDIYFLSREGTPFERESMPNFISSYSQVSVISRKDFETNEGGWKTLYNIDEKDTGYFRNHNAGVFKDAYGWLVAEDVLPVAVTVSNLNNKDFLWSYRIYYKEIELLEDVICPEPI